MVLYKYWDRVSGTLQGSGAPPVDANGNTVIVNNATLRSPDDVLLRTMLGFQLTMAPTPTGTGLNPPLDWGPRCSVSFQACYGYDGQSPAPPSTAPNDPSFLILDQPFVSVVGGNTTFPFGSTHWQTINPLDSHAQRKPLVPGTFPAVFGSFAFFSPDVAGPGKRQVVWRATATLATLWGSPFLIPPG